MMNHPFVDGNKRTGHAAMETFLVLNGYEIDAALAEQEQDPCWRGACRHRAAREGCPDRVSWRGVLVERKTGLSTRLFAVNSPPERFVMSREPIPTWYFALAVVRRGDRFLLVHEHKHGQLWHLLAGRAEPGEDLVAAACRETLEEAGISIRVTGIIRVEHSPRPGSSRVRVIFAAEPIDDAEPKSIPDEESLARLGHARRAESLSAARPRSGRDASVCRLGRASVPAGPFAARRYAISCKPAMMPWSTEPRPSPGA